MSFNDEERKRYSTHPNRVKLEELKCGDFFIVIDSGRYEDRYNSCNRERPWRFEGPVTIHSEYSRSSFCTCIGMDRHAIAQERYGQYVWFGKDPIIIKLPESQQAAWNYFYKSIDHGSEAHKLRWSEWYGKNCK